MSWFFGTNKTSMVTSADALPGRSGYPYEVPSTHETLGTPLQGPWTSGSEVIYLAMGCFWGAERKFWQAPGVICTAVGYQGGYTPFPTYEETCTSRTGHTESVLVVYDPDQISTYNILKIFWENHDPTTLYRQGNDIGTQYRSAAYWTTDDQRDLITRTRDAYNDVLLARGFDPITTEIEPAEDHRFYYAEPYHQQYLYKVPNGYDCHANTGIPLPTLG